MKLCLWYRYPRSSGNIHPIYKIVPYLYIYCWPSLGFILALLTYHDAVAGHGQRNAALPSCQHVVGTLPHVAPSWITPVWIHWACHVGSSPPCYAPRDRCIWKRQNRKPSVISHAFAIDIAVPVPVESSAVNRGIGAGGSDQVGMMQGVVRLGLGLDSM